MVTAVANIRYVYTVPDCIPEDRRVGECSICLEPYGETKKMSGFFGAARSWLLFCGLTKKTVAITKCEHVFHKTCLKTWLKGSTTCPHCRKTLKEEPPRILNRYITQIDEPVYHDYTSFMEGPIFFLRYR